MSLWQSSLWKGSPWAGSLWKSGQGFSQYALYLDFPRYGVVDKVSGKPLTTVISAGNRYDLVNGVQTVFTEDQPIITENGLRGVGAYENYFLNSATPVTQSITLAAGTYTIDITGTGSAAYDGNTATEGSHSTFVLGTETTADCTITGTVDTIIISESSYPLPYIPTTGTTAVSVSEAGAADYGNWADDIVTNFPLLYDALDGVADGVELVVTPSISIGWAANADGSYTFDGVSGDFHGVSKTIPNTPGDVFEGNITVSDMTTGRCYIEIGGALGRFTRDYISQNISIIGARVVMDSVNSKILLSERDGFDGTVSLSVRQVSPAKGTLLCEWTPGFDDQVLANKNIISVPNRIFYGGWGNTLGTNDGTTPKAIGITFVINTTYTIKVIWGDHPTEGTSKFQIMVTDGTTDWASAVTDFDNSFNPVDDLNFFFGNDYLQYIKSLKILKSPDWSAI